MQRSPRRGHTAASLEFLQRFDAIEHVRWRGVTRNGSGRFIYRAREGIAFGEQRRGQRNALWI
ncbi:MAG TPA: hypothetical protein VKE42_07245, partial [Candidatus Cybelea sp.]|nr:hypothetical protein [Candidatus Cybelea sp.]